MFWIPWRRNGNHADTYGFSYGIAVSSLAYANAYVYAYDAAHRQDVRGRACAVRPASRQRNKVTWGTHCTVCFEICEKEFGVGTRYGSCAIACKDARLGGTSLGYISGGCKDSCDTAGGRFREHIRLPG